MFYHHGPDSELVCDISYHLDSNWSRIQGFGHIAQPGCKKATPQKINMRKDTLHGDVRWNPVVFNNLTFHHNSSVKRKNNRYFSGWQKKENAEVNIESDTKSSLQNWCQALWYHRNVDRGHGVDSVSWWFTVCGLCVCVFFFVCCFGFIRVKL